MLESVVPLLITTFQMQRLIIVCDLDNTTLDLKQQLFKGNTTVKVAKSLSHIDENVQVESNIILCTKTVGSNGFSAMAYENHAPSYPCVILHHQGDELFLSPSGINQQLYFYNEDTNSLYEKYTVNSVVVRRQLNLNLPLENIYERRADLHGLSMNVAVNSILPLYGIMRKKTTDKITMSSGDEFYRLDKEDAFGMLEDLLTVVSRELNFTVR